MSIEKSAFGITPKGEQVDRYKLQNKNGMAVEIITYGGIISSVKVPNKGGVFEDVVIGFDSFEPYTQDPHYFGALIGRFGNRIANATFAIDGHVYQLDANNGPNALHGGPEGFHKAVWTVVSATKEEEGTVLKLKYFSKHMEEGFPGNLTVFVTYTLTEENALEVAYEATTDQTTIINLTQHTYFNLSADFSKPILDHEITIDADTFVAIDETAIPIGTLEDVSNTPFDFRTSKTIAAEIDAEHDQIQKGAGYDHCWVLNHQDKGFRVVASAYDHTSGRKLVLTTTEPGMQLYTGNYINGEMPSRDGKTYNRRSGFCFETQHYPDSPNQPSFPTTLLKVGETFKSKTSFAFSTL
ncbi:aldose epimerase family protein [Flavobacterium faecale]|uniref:aldose epimerase family protein n=1 Tax=Flavobacterium faecale TaxID=1355330 RepID=UPI001FE35514|nr:aldose epimerase family protein [Flavobacterium faecale]